MGIRFTVLCIAKSARWNPILADHLIDTFYGAKAVIKSIIIIMIGKKFWKIEKYVQ